MNGMGAVHECLFCSQTFGSAFEKDDHVLGHFSHENCSDCDQNLIRIGGKLYTLHDAVTCVRREFKPEPYTEAYIAEQSVISIQQSNDDDYETENFEPYENFSKLSYESTQLSMSDLKNDLMHEGTHIKQEETVVEAEYEEAIVTDADSFEYEETEPSWNQQRKCSETNTKSRSNGCEICGKILSTKTALRNHTILLHSAPGTIFCKMCSKLFSIQAELDEHRPECSMKKKTRYKKSSRKFAQSDHEDSILTETEPIEYRKTKKARKMEHSNKFECGICKKLLKRKWNLSVHMRAIHNSKSTKVKRDIPIKRKIDNYECFLCRSKFIYKQSLERHVLAKHVSKQKPFKCELCSERFLYESTRNNHRCPISGASTSANDHRMEITRDASIKLKINDYECYLCKTKILYKQSLERHMLSKHVSKKKPFQCDLCLARFLYETYRNKHPCPVKYLSDETSGASTSTGNQMFNAQNNAIQCQICNEIFDTKQSFTEHVSIHNWDGKQFKCKSCSASFWQAEKLEEHICIKTIRTHIKKPRNSTKYSQNSTKTETIICHICGKSLLTTSLQNHIKTVHSSDLKIYECDICSSTFRSDYYLRYHKRVKHDPNFKKFECELCSKSFSYVSKLRQHEVLAHSPAEALFCKICAKVLSNDEELDTHMTDCRMKYRKWHQRKMKVVECTICRAGIKGKNRLTKHMREEHGQEV